MVVNDAYLHAQGEKRRGRPPGERGGAPLADAPALLSSSLGKSAGARRQDEGPAFTPAPGTPPLPLYPLRSLSTTLLPAC